MPPVPKKKAPKTRQGGRRSHDHLNPIGLTRCPQCRSPRLPHHVCPTCGYYKGRTAIEVPEPTAQ
jgi:large subunit ribosomal protein L32